MKLVVLASIVCFACATPAQQLAGSQPNSEPSEYVITPGDQLEIKFFYSPELDEKVTVRPDGMIALQLIGDVKVAGISPQAADNLLRQRYSTDLVDPRIDVLVRSFARQRIFVDGQVGRPGVVELVGPLTVAEAVASGGGLVPGARATSVLVIRQSRLNEAPKVIEVNLKKILTRRPDAEDIVLEPYDIVYVPNSRIGNINKFVDLYVRKNLPMYIGLSWAPF